MFTYALKFAVKAQTKATSVCRPINIKLLPHTTLVVEIHHYHKFSIK